MNECYLGIDIGSISTKGVLIDKDYNVLASCYIWTEGNPTKAVKILLSNLKEKIDNNYILKGIGTTGSARKLIGLMLDATVIKNEITAHAVGTLSRHSDVRTILEIGGQDSKIIFLQNGVIVDYSMNTLCAAGTGAFLSSQAKRLGVDIEDFGTIALSSKNPVKIAARCTVFAESDLIHKAQAGYSKEDIIAGLSKSIVLNYLNNVAKGKKIKGPIVFQGGVSKNKGVLKYFEELLGEKVIVDSDGHLMGAIGVAILASKSETKRNYSWNMKDILFETKGSECRGCSNNCELLKIYKDKKLVDTWGSRCGKF
jgi:predicted CoA-substrate-specific enzyme activase